MFTRPGKISLDYCNGIRKKYFKPLSFFLLLVILYLLFPIFEGLNMKLRYHEGHRIYGRYAKEQVAKILAERKITALQLEETFHHAGEKTSKFLLFTIIPFVALVSWALGFKKRRFYFEHFIFSTELSSFFLLWGFLLFPFLLSILRPLTGQVFTSEAQLAVVIYFPFVVYSNTAAKRFFNFKKWYSILYAVLFTISLILFLENIYKFILFLIAIRMA
jgi:hypothetical protein